MDSAYATAGVSVVVCCFNSAARLPDTLRHLAGQMIPAGLSWEVILVNNASTDDTSQRAIMLWQQFLPGSTALRVIDEPLAGQMHARRTGVRSASYETIIFCDDDNWLDANYVARAAQMMDKDQRIGAGGGQNRPVTDAEKYPEWFETYKDKYAIGIPAPDSGDVTWKGFVLGAGLVTRRSIFLAVFDPKYPSLLNGRNGEQLNTGDDFEFCKRLLLWNYTLYYDEQMHLAHFIPKERLTIAYRDRLMAGILQAGKVLEQYDLAIRVLRRNRDKNRWRILLLSPLRSLLARAGWSGRVASDEALAFYYLAPFDLSADPVKSRIKRFYYHK